MGLRPPVRLGLGVGVIAFALQTLAMNALFILFARIMVWLSLGMLSAALMVYNFEVGASTGRFAALGSLFRHCLLSPGLAFMWEPCSFCSRVMWRRLLLPEPFSPLLALQELQALFWEVWWRNSGVTLR